MAIARRTRFHLGSPDHPVIIAHRGFSDQAPENSISAFQKAIAVDSDMIELDVRLTADNRFVVFHDKRLERTSSGRGLVKNRTAEELAGFDNGSWFSRRFARERIPLLDDVLPMAKEIPLNIEIKPDIVSTNNNSAIELLLSLINRNRSLHRVIFTSFNHRMMKEVKRLEHEAITGVIYSALRHFRRPPSQLRSSTHADIFICSKYQINGDVMADAHRSDLLVYVYGVRSERDITRMKHLRVDGLIVNDPHSIRRAMEARQ